MMKFTHAALKIMLIYKLMWTCIQTKLSPEYEDMPATIIVQENYENYMPFMGMVFQDIVQMLNDPNVCICHTKSELYLMTI